MHTRTRFTKFGDSEIGINKSIMPTIKEKIVKIIQAQPDDSSFDEILQELAFSRMIERGLEDARLGHTISNEEMQQRISAW